VELPKQKARRDNGGDTRLREHETASGGSHFGMMFCRGMKGNSAVKHEYGSKVLMNC
jgi:hypothetical protein